MTKEENDILWKEYLYPGTDVLINYYGIQDNQKLREMEATRSFERLLELREHPIDMSFDKNHLKAVHKYVFGDVYPFAGKYRKVNIAKKRGSFLLIDQEEDIDRYLDELFQDISEEMNHCYGKFDFCNILSHLYTSIIYCHPFREGNGRSAREFVREFSIAKSEELGLGSLELDWSKLNKEELERYIDVSHMFAGQIAIQFLEALTPIDQKENSI